MCQCAAVLLQDARHVTHRARQVANKQSSSSSHQLDRLSDPRPPGLSLRVKLTS